jgi:MinD superfamily P-loop ATPase
MRNRPPAIAIASGKGGTGKTALAANLAAYLAESRDVLLMDLDVEEPNAGLYFEEDGSTQNSVYSTEIPLVHSDTCTLCGKCVENCNFNALALPGTAVQVYAELCKSCGRCSHICPQNAISYTRQRIGVIRNRQKDRLFFWEGILDTGNIHTKALIQGVKKALCITLWQCTTAAN